PLRDAMRISAPAASCTRKAPSTWRFSSVKGSPAQSFVRGCHFHVFFTTVETATSRPVRTVASRLQTSGGFMLTDARGCPTSTPSSASLQQYERALDLCASYELDPLATIQRALDADPTFALGHCLRAGLAVMATDRGAVPMLAESVAAIESQGRRAHDRERAHAAAARAG